MKKTMRIALFVFPHDAMGGAERVTRTVAHAALISGQYDEVVCFVLSRGRTGTLDKLADLPGARVVYSPALKMRAGLSDLYQICRRSSYAFTFCSFTDLNGILCLFRRLRVLHTDRLVTRESTMFFERDFGWKTPLVRRIFWLYGAQDMIVCQTARMARSMRDNTGRYLHQKIQVVPNPLDYELQEALHETDTSALEDIPEGRFLVAWCGRVAPVKSPLRALQTLKALHELGLTHAHLVMIGDGPMRGEVLELATKLGLSNHLTLTGFQQRPARLMQCCEAGLITSDIEGFPNVVLEMLASGVRGVASTDCAGGLSDIPGIVLAQSNTPQALADALLTVYLGTGQPDDVSKELRRRSPEQFLTAVTSSL